MKLWKKLIITSICVITLVGCGSKSKRSDVGDAKEVEGIITPQGKDDTIKIGVTAIPHGEIMKEVVEKKLLKAGWEVDIITFNDYVQPNTSLKDGEIDANFYQTDSYLKDQSKQRNLDLVNVANIHLEPMGLYSNTYKDINKLKDGATIAIPNAGSNESRAIQFLASQKLIEVDSSKGSYTLKSIKKNPHKFKITQLDPANLARSLDDVDMAVINANFALEAKLNPNKDALRLENTDIPDIASFYNCLVVPAGQENTNKTKALKQALQSKEVKKYIETKYKGAVTPVF